MTESIFTVTIRSIYVSSIAALIAFLSSLALNAAFSKVSRKYVEVVSGVFEALVGVPTTVIGLLVYMLLLPGGPLGTLKLLYTPYAIIIGEFLVALPMVYTYMSRHYYVMRDTIRELVLSLGCPEKKAFKLLLRELTPILLSAYFVSFSRAMGELGVALIVGGGIEGYTNVLTTAIALQTSIGNYEYAIQLGAILVSITIILVVTMKILGERILWRLD
jgi:ABC-type tungstate transport system, periplasmic component